MRLIGSGQKEFARSFLALSCAISEKKDTFDRSFDVGYCYFSKNRCIL